MLYYSAPAELTLNKPSSFVCHYFLESPSIYLVEIKRNDLSLGEVAPNYQWLSIHKTTFKITPLTVRFVDSSAAIEERFFEEGYLKFNATHGTFIEKFNSAQHPLIQIHQIEIPSSINQAIVNFIKE